MSPALRFVSWLVVLFFLSVAPLHAQGVLPSAREWTHGTTLNVFAGAASASSRAGAAVGGAVGWEITPWLGIEGTGTWFDRQQGEKAFAADLTGQVRLTQPHPVVPFVEAGVGMLNVSFDGTERSLPGYYAHRGGVSGLPSASFRDTSFVVGGGLDLFLSRHIAIRPQVRAIVARDHGENYPVTTFAVHLAYHFERHPVEPR